MGLKAFVGQANGLERKQQHHPFVGDYQFEKVQDYVAKTWKDFPQ